MPSRRRSSGPDMDTSWSSAAEIAEAVTAGHVSAMQVTEDALARIKARDPALNSFTDVLADRARTRARAIDEARVAKRPLGPLAGVVAEQPLPDDAEPAPVFRA